MPATNNRLPKPTAPQTATSQPAHGLWFPPADGRSLGAPTGTLTGALFIAQ